MEKLYFALCRVVKPGVGAGAGRVSSPAQRTRAQVTVPPTALGDYDREVRLELDRTYPVCEYRLQYDETDLDFVHRLMEEEGIIYWFDHEGEREVLVLADHPKRHASIDRPEGAALLMSQYGTAGGNFEVVREFHRRSQVHPTRLAVRHYDWTRDASIVGRAESAPPDAADPPDGSTSGPTREQYEHENRPLTLYEYAQTSYTSNDTDEQVRLRRELHARDARVGEGASTVIALRPGQRFELVDHRQPELVTGTAGSYVGTVGADIALTAGNDANVTAKKINLTASDQIA